jgi:mono/diheme cytochrome c family protein
VQVFCNNAPRPIRSIVCLIMVTLVSATASAADFVAMSGQQLYTQFCASCHGPEARGDGPVALSFAKPIPDLTLIARRHGGPFPREWVEQAIDGRQKIGAHGAYTMPVWGEDFSRAEIGSPNAEQTTRMTIAKLVDYLETLQRK